MNPTGEKGKYRELLGSLTPKEFDDIIRHSRMRHFPDTVTWLKEWWVHGEIPEIDRRLMNNKNRRFKRQAEELGYYWK